MYSWKITLNSVDISDKVSRFSIACSLDSFCREMTLDISDPDLYAELDFAQISEAPEIEIFTRTGEDWISQGEFFVERPALAATVQSDLMQGVWGRSLTAKLAEPFAPKITKAWEEKTTVFHICEEMCDLAGFEWDPAYSDIEDFVIHPYTYEAEGMYPIDVISELAMLAGALVTTDRLGHLCIKQIDYAPSPADATITDGDIRTIAESPEWPVFANRVRITPTGDLGNYSVTLVIPDPCLKADGSSRAKLYAQVRDPDGEAVDGLAVAWEADGGSATLERSTSNTQEISIRREPQRATDFYSVTVDFPPSAVDGVYAYSDTARRNNFAGGGYERSGNTITLKNKLAYCDQSVLIDYRAGGMAVNYLQAGDEDEDVTVTAKVEGQADSGIVYIDNPCECPPQIRLTAAPTSINPGGRSSLIVYGEESGPITTGRMVFMAEVSAVKRGTLSWTFARLGTVGVANEQASAINEIAGVTRCEISMFPASVASVYAADENGNPTGGNLYSSHAGKVIDLNGIVATATDLLINYTARGAALNHFTGAVLGTATINAWMLTNREAGAEANATVRIVDNTQITDEYPSGWAAGEGDGGYGGTGGDSGGEDDEGYDPSTTGEGGGDVNWCIPENVSADPSVGALAARFATALEHDCTCEETCGAEFYIFDTIQSYDGASGRDISEIVTQDYGLEEGSPEYWEKFAELKAEALAECVEQCDECLPVMTWSEDNPETIDPEDQVAVSVAGGAGPYTWSVGGTGFSLGASETEDGVNLLNSDENACGAATITVHDACGTTVTGYLRCTAGGWAGCGSYAQGGCCGAGCESGELYFDNIHKCVYQCGTRSGYGTDQACGDGDCSGFCITSGDCPQSEGKLCSADFYYWDCQ